MPAKECTHDVAQLICESDSSMTYSWYKSKDGLEHTGIILEFDGSQTLALDFGANMSTFKDKVNIASKFLLGIFSPNVVKKKFATMKLAGEVNLSSYNGLGKKRVGTLLDLNITGPEEKEKALAIFKSVKKVGQEMKKYQLMENNCRDYVIAVAKMLEDNIIEKNSENWNKFESEMQKLKSNDQQKYQDVKNAIDLSRRYGPETLNNYCSNNPSAPNDAAVAANLEAQSIQMTHN